MRYQGKITQWNDAKGYGFVTPNGGGTRAFVHVKSFTKRGRRPVDGELITYELKQDSKDRTQAVNIRYPDDKYPETRKSESKYASYIMVTVFGTLVLALTVLSKIPPAILFIDVIASGVTFLAYAFDKAAAMNRRWRTKENTLHLLGAVGGWPGALIAQKMFRHKSKKIEFQVVFWFTVLVNCAALTWFTTENGSRFLQSILKI